MSKPIDVFNQAKAVAETRAALGESLIQPLPGMLPDGKVVYRVDSSQFEDAYGYFVLPPEAQVIRLNTKAARPYVSKLLQKWGEPAITTTPEYIVLPYGEGKDESPLQFINISAARTKTNLAPLHETERAAVQTKHVVPLENGLVMALDMTGRQIVYEPATKTAYSGRWRLAPRQGMAEMFRAIAPTSTKFSKQWQNIYARELTRTLITYGLPQLASRAKSLATITPWESMQANALSLEDLATAVTSRAPSDYWERELQARSTRSLARTNNGQRVMRTYDEQGNIAGENTVGIDVLPPPHLKLTSESEKTMYAAIAQLNGEIPEMYARIARARMGDMSNTLDITAAQIRDVQLTITSDEILSYLAASDERPKSYKADIEKSLGTYGVTPDMLAGLGTLPKPQQHPEIHLASHVAKGHAGKDRTSMFDTAVKKEIANRPHWAEEIHSPLSQRELAQAMSVLAHTPLFEVHIPREANTPEGRAEIIWKILSSHQVEAKNQNKRSAEAEAGIRAKIADAIKAGRPIDFLIFGPWGTAPSVLRSGGRQTPHLGHLDFLTHMLRVNATIEQVYKPKGRNQPAMKIHWVNESSSFAGVLDHRTRADVDAFESRMIELLHVLSPEREVFKMYPMLDTALPTDAHRAIFEEFKANYAAYTRKMFDTYDAERSLPSNKRTQSDAERAWVEERRQLIYPISTIPDPFDVLPHATPLGKIVTAYEYIRADVFGKMDQFEKRYGRVDADVKQIANALRKRARELVITQYVPIMDSRYHTPGFVSNASAERYRRIDPWTPLYGGKIHGRITDGGKDRVWFILNSDAPIIHPTHGIAVLEPETNPGNPHHFTIRTYAEIAAEPDRYAAVYLKGDEQSTPHHFIQLR